MTSFLNKRFLLKLLSLFSVVRGYNIIFIVFAQLISSIFIFSTNQSFYEVVFDHNIWLIIISSACSISAGYIINNVYDSDKDPVKIKFNKNIIGIVARAGWGTISNSVILNKPLIVFPYSEGDDPEIFFNVEVLKDLDIAAIYDSALSFSENLDIAISKLPNMCSFKNQILIKYGMLNGSRYCAEVMFFDMHNVDRFLRFSDKEVL